MPFKRTKEPVGIKLKFALEIGPLLIFFLVTFTGKELSNWFEFLGFFGKPLFMATALFMVATFFSLTILWSRNREIPFVPLFSTIMIMIFGSLSIWFQDDTFIKMKPTILYSFLGLILLASAALEKALPRYLFGSTLQLDKEGWKKLSFRWGIACLCCAIVNEIVWRGLEKIFPADLADKYWASFKFFGLTGLTFIFVLSQMPMIRRHLIRNTHTENSDK